MKTLIIYYSRTDTTKKIAEEIKEKLGAELVEIESPEMKKGFFGFLKAGKQAFKKIIPEIREISEKVEDFDLVIIGTPIWVGTMASPIRAFLVKNKGNFNEVAFFCTCGDKQTMAFDEIRRLTGKEPKATLELKRKEIKKNNYQQKLIDFANKLIN